jgi:hypothetical protein
MTKNTKSRCLPLVVDLWQEDAAVEGFLYSRGGTVLARGDYASRDETWYRCRSPAVHDDRHASGHPASGENVDRRRREIVYEHMAWVTGQRRPKRPLDVRMGA